jgi:MFS family permease
MIFSFRHTRYACYAGYITQAIVNNLAPLFFIIFSETYSISYKGLGSLVMLNFMIQLAVDAACVKLAVRIGYKPLLIIAQAVSGLGLVLLGVLPLLLTHVFAALVISVIIYAIGGGLLEVLVSPVVDSIPTEAGQKPAAMSLLHSFYCWGQAAVILLTTLLLSRFGRENWFILPLLWAVVPLANMFLFIKVPIIEALPEKESMGLRRMAGQPVFFLCLILMLCAGASEQSVSQWASLFAEKALNLPKVMGDIFGPAMFALFMGTGRIIYGIWGAKIKLYPYMLFSAALCIFCYFGLTLAPHPMIQLAACALTGFSVSIMWPAVFSLSSAAFPRGGPGLFALLALMGDLGCGSGPWIAGLVSDAAGTGGIFRSLNILLPDGDVTLKAGILVCIVFPVSFVISLVMLINLSTRIKTRKSRE